MAFWLADRRKGQHSSWLQRFDPRFWTVDFPRPAMASVVTIGPDSMQIDCEFHHEGELVGLIWESEDTLDHPLLAYETSRDYSHTILRFRWQSTGLIPLDQANGPTLTIEGRDAAGAPKSWYVRLWNYATGTPTDAQIELPFSNLGSGWLLPGEAVHPADIDRMFISLVPPGFVPSSAAQLASRANGSVTVSEISCDGQFAMLELGSVLVPPHGERIATAYDDAYNQTPARLVRNMHGLGYREEAIHYVGMSHFMRLSPNGGSLEVEQTAKLCTPAREWHLDYFDACRTYGIDVIVSLSYELFDEYCPDSWKQRDHTGSAAQTGWVPPSTLLSPANAEAMAWLQQVAALFVELQEQAQQPVRFQIGEPWWWVMPDTRAPCLYDAAASAALGGSTAIIDDLRAALDASQIALLDAAGALLAQSTSDLAQAARDAAAGPAEILLLAFTPTILDPQMPDLHRANLPIGWAYPAFDRLQLEDYDWLTGDANALRRTAYQTVDEKLGYPITSQDYLAGFVLNSADAETGWRLIDAALDEAELRGVSRRFVWALPQVTRDGFIRLPQFEEPNVQAFDDVLYPFALGKSASAQPEFSTSVKVMASGHERRNSLWSDARMQYDVGPGIRSEEELSELIGFFRARRGAARGFRITDPFDFSSNGMTGTPTVGDQLLGIGDGLNADFRLVKNYGDGSAPQVRSITRPQAGSILVSVDGQPSVNWTLETGGIIRFATAPANGAEVRAGFKFDVPVRFAEDRIDISGISFAAGEAPSIPLIEIRETE